MKIFVKNMIRSAFQTQGIDLVSVKRFGVNPWHDVQKLAQRWGSNIQTTFDVGANDGETTALLLQHFPGAKVISFEPQAALATKLESRFAQEPAVRVERLALGNTEGPVQFFEYEYDKIASMAPNAPFAVRFNQSPRATEVPCTTVDHYCAREGIEQIDVLKIDTEGNDHLVLEGAAGMIAAGRIRFVYVEFNTLEPVDGQFGGALTVLNRLLHPAGYCFIASYTDHLVTELPMFSVCNALFALPHRG